MAELSGLEVAALVSELTEQLAGCYVNQVYRIGPSQLIRFRKPGGDDAWLVVSPKRGVWLSREVTERTETTEFTTRLRSELERARFLGAHQVDLDRIFELDFEGKEPRRLVVELMPPGNVVVTGTDDVVLVALHEFRAPARTVARRSVYRPPPQSRLSPADVGEDDVRSMLTEEKTVGAALGRHIALPRKYVSECLARVSLEDDSPSASAQGREGDVVRALSGMVAEARERPRPCICETARGDDIFVFPPSGLRVKETAKTLSELCDRLFLQEAQWEPAEDPAEARRKETLVTIARLKDESASLRADASRLREAAAKAGGSPMDEGVRILEELRVKPRREPTSPSSIASLLFDQAKSTEAKAAAALETAERLDRKAPKVVTRGQPRARLLPSRRHEWYEKFRWFFTTGGRLAIGGRDAQTNTTLINRHLEDRDTVYHADLFGSPFFILKGGEDQSDDEVRQVSQATVAFSSAWKTGLGAADAYWVRPDQVKTAAPSGEYLQRGSFAIVGKKNFISKILVEVAVGVDGEGRVIAGPEEAVRRSSAAYLVLRPQREKGSDTAKRVLKGLAGSDGGGRPIGLDAVLRVLPTGGGKIVRRSEGGPGEGARSGP